MKFSKTGSWAIFAVMIASHLVSCAEKKAKSNINLNNTTLNTNIKMDTATFGSGCFWCTEAFFQNLEGVYTVSSGYTGGKTENPTYNQICRGNTGHAEVIQLTYDPQKISFEELLEVFWKTHDPTTLNRQGNDEGTQYRSAIFYHNEDQKRLAEIYKKKLDESGAWSKPIVTEITPISKFYKAEDYHQNYYNQNGSESYCAFVIQPKLEKFKKVFHDKLKKK
ncbi:MAG TPA: peptide-methionine (S)-S-oxide reductase MsrA [Cytophagaceae bacterium]|jgi:peptide-methionine (S)-S-oxide reductase